MNTINKDKMINLSLSVEEVNMIINALATCPYREVYQLIDNIQKQGQAQMSLQSEDLENKYNNASYPIKEEVVQ